MSEHDLPPEMLSLLASDVREWSNVTPQQVHIMARRVIAAEKLAEALRRIAEGPWPEGIDSPEEQARFDAAIARAALAAWDTTK